MGFFLLWLSTTLIFNKYFIFCQDVVSVSCKTQSFTDCRERQKIPGRDVTILPGGLRLMRVNNVHFCILMNFFGFCRLIARKCASQFLRGVLGSSINKFLHPNSHTIRVFKNDIVRDVYLKMIGKGQSLIKSISHTSVTSMHRYATCVACSW